MKITEKSMKKRYVSLCVFFYITLLLLPVFAFLGADLSGAYAAFFKIPVINYLLYLSPAALCVFFVKSKALLIKNIFYNYAFALILAALIILYDLKNAAGSYTFAFAGILLLSVMLINVNELAACLILIPGVFIKNLSFGYIISAYIPVLLMLAVSFFYGRGNAVKTENSEKKSINFLFPAYCYITVLTAVLTAAGILIPRPESLFRLNTSRDYINFALGMVLVFVAFVIFLISSFPLFKNKQTGVFTKISIILTAVYPLCAAAAGLFTSFISPNFKTVILFILLLYVSENIHFSLNFENKFSASLKLTENPAAIFIGGMLFCGFILGNPL